MMTTIVERIVSTIPRTGCRVKALRCVLHDVDAAPLDYAIQGLIRAGRYVMADGFIRPAPKCAFAAALPAPIRRDHKHPWRRLLAVQKG